jgi:hypothetical protein
VANYLSTNYDVSASAIVPSNRQVQLSSASAKGRYWPVADTPFVYRLYITEARRVNYIDKAIHDRLDSAYIGTTATTIPGNCQTASLAGQPTLRRLHPAVELYKAHNTHTAKVPKASYKRTGERPCTPAHLLPASRARLGHFLRRRLGQQASICGVW